jgi:hypothetical protein
MPILICGNDRLQRILRDLHGFAHGIHFGFIFSEAQLRQHIARIGIVRFGRASLHMTKFQQTQLTRLDADPLPIQTESLRGVSKGIIPL